MLARSWVAVCALALIVASDYQIRRRSPTEALSGSVDAAIVLEVGLYAFVAAFVVLAVADPPRWKRPRPVVVALWSWCAVSLASAVYSPYVAMGIVRGLQLLVAGALATAAVRHAARAHFHRFAHAYVVLTTASVAFGLAFPFPRTERHENRFNWLYVHPVIAGTFLGIAVVVLLAYVLRRGEGLAVRWPVGVYGALLAVNGVALVASITRAAIAATFVGCLAVAGLLADTKRRIDLAVFALVATVLVVLVFGGPLVEYLQRGQTDEAFRTLSARTTLWALAWELFTQRPVLGYGLMATRGVFLEETTLGSAHNAVFEVAINSGVVGLVAWGALIVITGRGLHRAWASGRDLDVPLLAGVFTFLLVNGMSTEGPGLPANVQSMWLLVVAAWVGVIRRRQPVDELAPVGAGGRRR